jgi:uncharacterized protein (DUF427 family)
MADRPHLIPGPDHPITVDKAPQSVRVLVGDRVIAETDAALVLTEASYPPVHYIPLSSVDPDVLVASESHTYCPYKGEASYYSLRKGDEVVDDAVWVYPTPYDAVADIADHVAFYPQHVTIEG